MTSIRGLLGLGLWVSSAAFAQPGQSVPPASQDACSWMQFMHRQVQNAEMGGVDETRHQILLQQLRDAAEACRLAEERDLQNGIH